MHNSKSRALQFCRNFRTRVIRRNPDSLIDLVFGNKQRKPGKSLRQLSPNHCKRDANGLFLGTVQTHAASPIEEPPYGLGA